MNGGVMLSPQDVFQGLMNRTMKLWLAFDGSELRACCVTQLANYPRIRCLNVLVIAGVGVDDWLHFSRDVEDYARVLDCEAIEAVGREGWKRVAAQFGYKPIVTIYRKAL